jgi:hypothetical protein
MTAARLVAIGFIYLCAALAWSILGGTVVARTGESDARLAQEVAQLWGGRHEQGAPQARYEIVREVREEVQGRDEQGRATTTTRRSHVVDVYPVALDSSRVTAELTVDHRRKGLLWYPTYAVAFRGVYTLHNPSDRRQTVLVEFPFPSSEALYDGFVLRFAGQAADGGDLSKGARVLADVAPGASATVEVAYRSRGMGVWSYAFAPSGVGLVKDFQLDLATNVSAVDFPAGSISPTARTRAGAGWSLRWAFESLVTGQKIALEPPNKLNPGPLAARITFFAPVALLFFMTVLVMLGVLSRENLHPMNYFFLAAAFFAFHLLLAYLADQVDLHVAFATASVVSLFLVASYLRLVAGMRYALLRAGVAQLVFLVLFSYAFFFEGYTGLTVTIGAILTLFVLMQLTGRVDWNELFARRAIAPVPPPRERSVGC